MENVKKEKALKCKVLFVTARNLVLQVMDEDGDYETEPYDIYLDGVKRLSSVKTVESVYGLCPDTRYQVQLGRGNYRSDVEEVRTLEEFVTLDVRDFGAKGDGIADDTQCLQAAILTCPPKGRVYIPEGVFCVTNLFLKSDLLLELGKNAVIRAIPDERRLPVLPGRIESYDERSEFIPALWEGYPRDSYASLFTGMAVENVVIYGQGTLDGCADFDNWWGGEIWRGDHPARPRMIFLNHCRNVVVQGLTIRNSPAWNLHPSFCQHLKFYDLYIESPSRSRNTDGLNPESCEDVEAAGIYFSVGDDCIAIKSGKIYMGQTYKTPSKDIFIHHCRMEKGHGGVTIGSEIAAGVDNIQIRNCRFVGTDRGLRVKTRRGRGREAYLNGITFDKVRMERVKTAFVINCFYYCDPDGKTEYVSTKRALPVDDRTPRVGAVTIRNVTCVNCQIAGIYIYGLPESKVESVVMENVKIEFARNAIGGQAAMMVGCEVCCKQGIFIRNAKKVVLKDVELCGYNGEPIDIEEVDEWEWNET